MKFLPFFILLLPFFVFAAPRDFGELVDIFITIINSTIIPVLFAISLVAFLWGVAQYNIFSSSEEKKTSGRQIMVWGIIAFVVMVLVWGIVKIINTSIFNPIELPTPTSEDLFIEEISS